MDNLLETVLASLDDTVAVEDGRVVVKDEAGLRGEPIDRLAHTAVFGSPRERGAARWLLWELGQALGIYSTTIHPLYIARGKGEVPGGFTVPAMNLRAMTYDMARAVFRAAIPRRVGAMIFEIARSEIGYTDQRPSEYISSVLAAAIKEGYRGPLFVQGDHFQVNAGRYAKDPEGELNAVRELTEEALQAGFFNIDVDTSTLVDLSKPTVDEQQRLNYTLCAELTAFIREREPEGITVSVGGEIGEVGGKNSDERELRAFMDGFNRTLPEGMVGLSKISIQTGTSHGGVVLPDGSLAQVAIDFDVMRQLSEIARKEYGMGGAVQHGASTLPDEAFNEFVKAGALEVHLATGFQNIIYDLLPEALREEVYAWLKEHYRKNWKPGQTEEQFLYKERKRALGPFKAQFWGLPEELKGTIRERLEAKFGFLFEQLGVVDTLDLAVRYAPRIEMHRSLADYLGGEAAGEDVEGLAD